MSQFNRQGSVDPERHNPVSRVNHVQLDSVVTLKVIKHSEDERRSGSMDIAQGYLVGLVAAGDRRLEVTNCFPIAKVAGDDDDDAMGTHQSQMLKKFQQINVDYLLIGFYQSSPFGACFNETFVESVFDYQSSVNDSVVLVYDPVKTSQGIMTIKAYRLSPMAMKLCYKDFSSESIKRCGLSYENLFEELPVSIKNSHLVNIALCELALTNKSKMAKPSFLELGGGGNLERSIRQLMSHTDSLNNEVTKYNRYMNNKQKHDAQRESQLQKRKMENESRRLRGEEPVLDEEFTSTLKPLVVPSMLDSMLAASEINAHADHVLSIATQNLGKLFMAEAVFEEKKERTTST